MLPPALHGWELSSRSALLEGSGPFTPSLHLLRGRRLLDQCQGFDHSPGGACSRATLGDPPAAPSTKLRLLSEAGASAVCRQAGNRTQPLSAWQGKKGNGTAAEKKQSSSSCSVLPSRQNSSSVKDRWVRKDPQSGELIRGSGAFFIKFRRFLKPTDSWRECKPEQARLAIDATSANPNLSAFSKTPSEPRHAKPLSGADPKLSASSSAEDDPLPLSLDSDPADRRFDRLLAYLGLLDDAAPLFRSGASIPRAGALLALPALIESGALDCARRVYGTIGPAFYGLRTTIVALLLMALRFPI